jgi:formylglycine-generating enzyme required for sulfatase activity
MTTQFIGSVMIHERGRFPLRFCRPRLGWTLLAGIGVLIGCGSDPLLTVPPEPEPPDGPSIYRASPLDTPVFGDSLVDDDDDDHLDDDDDDTPRWCDPIEGSTIPMIVLPPGEFEMGCPEGADCLKNEGPVHHVTRTVEACIGWTEITNEQWDDRLPDNPSIHFACGPDCPVEGPLFAEVIAFANAESEAAGLEPCYLLIGCDSAPGSGTMMCERVEVTSESESVLDCEGFRLPTEAEWEHAAGAGGGTLYAGSNDLDEVAWHLGNSNFGPNPVAGLEPNLLGLHDMSGNVWEWTWDCWQYRYDEGPAVDPTGQVCQGERSSRGGGWTDIADSHRVTGRSGDPLWHGDDNLGLRLARSRL